MCCVCVKNVPYRISYIVILIGIQISQLASRKHIQMVEPIMQQCALILISTCQGKFRSGLLCQYFTYAKTVCKYPDRAA